MEAANPQAAEEDAAAEQGEAAEGQAGEQTGAPAGLQAGEQGDTQADAEPQAGAAAGASAAQAAETAAAEPAGDDGAVGGASAEAGALASGPPAGAAAAGAGDAAAGGPASAGGAAGTAASADPEQAERAQAGTQSRSEQADSQRAAQQASDEHAEAQVAQQAESGGAGGEGGEAQLSDSEKSAAASELGEGAGGGGGGGEAAAAGGIGGGGGAGGGDGGAAAAEEAQAPDTASQTPEAGLASAATLGPVAAAGALAGVGSAIGRTAEEEGSTLQSDMPQHEVGADDAGGTAVQVAEEGAAAGSRPQEVDAGASEPVPEPEPTPAAPPAPTEGIATPSVQAGEGGKADPEDARRVQGAVRNLPTEDAGLDVSAGAPPKVELSGDADPATAEQQKAELDATVTTQREQGAADAAAPAGEDDIRVRRPRETLAPPSIAKPGADGGAGGGADAAAAEEGVAIIADEKQGDEVRGATAQAQAEMAARRGAHRAKVEEEKARNAQEMEALRAGNTAEQAAERGAAQGEVRQARNDWTAEQASEVAATNKKAQKELSQGHTKVSQAQAKGDQEAGQHIETGEQEAAGHKAQAEADAARKKRDAESESDGVFGWLSSKVTSFFDALKRGLTAIFDAAKKLVRTVIDKAKKLAVAAIEAARKAIVSVIQAVGAALIALGDVLLAAFPGLKRKWRRFIEHRVRDAERAVNKLADKLKAGITKLLDALGKAFEFLLDAYKKAMFAVLDAAKAVALGAIKAAKAVADALGTFAVLIRDIAKGPMSWISKLGAAAQDGVKNHLWSAFKTAVKEWFNSKLEEVLGIGGLVWGVLKKGGLGLKDVGTMAFEGLKAAIPAALISILIEKVVAMIIPAAGAVLAIIEGLQAAWGTVQRILSAIGKFVAFLKAVKGGGAGPAFGGMVAAAAVVVIDFVANWLLKKLRGPASKIGGKIKAIAAKIMARIKRVAKTVGGALKRAGRKIKGKFKAGKKRFDDWRARRKAKRDAKGKDGKTDPNRQKQDKAREMAERLRKAIEAIRPQVQSMAGKGKLSGIVLRAKLLFWKARYRLTSLAIQGGEGLVQLVATVNPSDNVMAFVRKNGRALRKIIYDVGREIMEREDVGEAAKRLQAQMDQGAGRGGKKGERLELGSGVEAVALAKIMRQDRERGSTFVQFAGGGKASVTRKERRPTGKPLLGPGNQVVNEGGDYADHPSMFSAAAARDSFLSRHGGGSQQIQSLANVTMLGGGSRHRDPATRDFAARQALLRITEMSRNDQAVVVSTDLAQLHGQGGIDHGTALRGDPMAPGGAVGTGRNLESKTMGSQPDAPGQGDVPLRANASKLRHMREQQLVHIAGIMVSKYGAENVMFSTEGAVTDAVRADVKNALKQITERNLGLPHLP